MRGRFDTARVGRRRRARTFRSRGQGERAVALPMGSPHPGHRSPPFQSTACRPFPGTRYQEQHMNMNKDQVKGHVKEVKGTIKEIAGKLVGNEKLEQKGKIQKIVGEAQVQIGDIKESVKDAVKGA
jgi:uncharacterized protein YjbJ (UPF0337 family)